MTNRHRAAVSFIFVSVLLGMVAFGIALPPLPKLIAEFVGGDIARASADLGLFGTTFALMQFFFSPVLGMLSDRYGRRPVLLLSNFGAALDYMIMAMAPSLRWLFLGRILSGLTASGLSTATAYMSDVTPPEKRSKAFGLLAAAYGGGFIVGPVIGGWLGCTIPVCLFGWLALPTCSTLLTDCLFFPNRYHPKGDNHGSPGKKPILLVHSGCSARTPNCSDWRALVSSGTSHMKSTQRYGSCTSCTASAGINA